MAYFQEVKAPQKTLVLIPDAGHFAFMTAPDAFLAALTAKVRPWRGAPDDPSPDLQLGNGK